MVDGIEPPFNLPGQEMEKAAAKVATKAGTSIVGGIASVAGAFFAEWIASKKANAAAARMAIETKAKIDRAEAFAEHHRKQDIDAIEHSAVVQRRLARLGQELLWQQENFEAIALRSIEIAEQDRLADRPRAIDTDWMFRFSRLSQDASDSDIQDLWARILSSAAIEGRRKVSPAGLQIMSLIDSRTASDFRKFCDVAATFGFFPGHDNVYKNETQDVDVGNLQELGLVGDDPISGAYSFGDFELRVGAVGGVRIDLLKTTFSLTRRGAEIADAVFSNNHVPLSLDLQQLYLQEVISNQVNVYHSISITLPPKDEVWLPFALQIMNKRTPPPEGFPLSSIRNFASDRLWFLLQWAQQHYEILRIAHASVPFQR
jgi:hypothetical protein